MSKDKRPKDVKKIVEQGKGKPSKRQAAKAADDGQKAATNKRAKLYRQTRRGGVTRGVDPNQGIIKHKKGKKNK